MSAKFCKYGCGAMLTWNTKISKFIEPDGTTHAKERCEGLQKQKQPAPVSNDAAINEIRTAITHLSAAIEALARPKA